LDSLQINEILRVLFPGKYDKKNAATTGNSIFDQTMKFIFL